MAKIHLTAGRIRDYTLAEDKKQSFLWDDSAPGLGIRATTKVKAYIFESRHNGRKLRITIGDVRAWGIDKARTEARRLQMLIDQGMDPRQVKAEKLAAVEAKRREATEQQAGEVRQEITVSEAWEHYLEARSSKWGEHHRRDHLKLARPAGQPTKRRGGSLSTAGPLAVWMPIRLAALTAGGLEAWLKEETAKRPTTTAKAYRVFHAFLNWCSEQTEYSDLVEPNTLLTKKVRGEVASSKAKDDCLKREQLPVWFDAVRQHSNPVIPAYLQALLLTGARREELGTLTWENVDFQWQSLTVTDKDKNVEERVIPLTPYVAALLAALPRRNKWVFSSLLSASGRLMEPSIFHRKAIAAAGLPSLSLHGLRRSFGTLSEWVEVPSGMVAQIMGHKPSALVEKHYRRRPLDLLRVWHIKLEAWILEQAGIEFDAEQNHGLRMVK